MKSDHDEVGFVTLLWSQNGQPANKQISLANGQPVKRAHGDRGAYMAQVVCADTPEALTALLQEAGERPDALMSLGYVPALAPPPGKARGVPFRIMSRKQAARILGLSTDLPAAHLDAAFGAAPRQVDGLPTVTRTRRFWRFGGWLLFDRDPNADMPDDIRRIVSDDAAWLTAMERLAPGFAQAGRVRLRSSTGRVRWHGAALPTSGRHEYVRLDRRDAVGAVAGDLEISAVLAGLAWRKVAKSRTTGAPVSSTLQPIWDPATFSPERLVFVGAPDIAGVGLTLDPPMIEVFPGAVYPVDAVPDPDAEDRAEASRRAGAAFKGSRRRGSGAERADAAAASGIGTTAKDLTLDTRVVLERHGELTVREACIREMNGERAQVPDVFRASVSWNAMLWRRQDGAPVIWDRGARVLHVLSDAEREVWEIEFLLPPVVADAPPPSPSMPMADAETAVAGEVATWLAEAFTIIEHRIRHDVWTASWTAGAVQCGITPPAAFLPRPEPTRLASMIRPVGNLEMLKVSTAVGKTARMVREVVRGLTVAPMVLGLRRRVFVVAKDHRIADELAQEFAVVSLEQGNRITVSRYRGIAALNPVAPPDTAMCLFHQARREAHAAGLPSGRACSVRVGGSDDDDDPNRDGRRIYCMHHPDNPQRQAAPCGWAAQDLSGSVVIFAGWTTLTRALTAGQFRRSVTMQGTVGENGKRAAITVAVDPCDALILDETDIGQLVAGSRIGKASNETEDDGGSAAGTIATSTLPTALWPNMLTAPFDECQLPDAINDKAAADTCNRLLPVLRQMVAELGDGTSLSPAALATAGTPEEWTAASRWAWRAKEADTSLVRPNQAPQALREKLAVLRAHNQMVGATARLLKLCAEAVEHCPEDTETELVRVYDGTLWLRGALPLKPWCADLPTLLLDATGNLDLLRTWWPNAIMRQEIKADWARDGVEHVVLLDYAGSYQQLTPGRVEDTRRTAAAAASADRTAALAMTLDWLFDGAVLIAGPKAHVMTARDRVPVKAAERVKWMWFGAARGLNAAQDVRVATVIGRPLPPSHDLETATALLRHGRPVAADCRGYEPVAAYHRMADGKARLGTRYRHRDQLADVLLRHHTLSDMEQTEQRARLLRRDALRPVLVISASNLALGDCRRVDRLVSKQTLRLHPEMQAALAGVVVRREDRGALALLAWLLAPKDAAKDQENAARRVWDRLSAWPAAGLWDAAMAPGTEAADPAALARWASVENGWAAAGRKKIAAEAAAGLWWPALVRLPSADAAVGVMVRGATTEAVQARLAEALGEAAKGVEVTWTRPMQATEANRGKQPEASPAGRAAEVAADAMHRAIAGGGMVDRAEAMVATGFVPLDRDHAVAVYPGLFTARGAARRPIAAALEMLGGSAKGSATTSKAGFAYKDHIGKTRFRAWCGPFQQVRYRAETNPRLATAWVAADRMVTARELLEASLGPLAVWRVAMVKPAKSVAGVAEPPAPDSLPPDPEPGLDPEFAAAAEASDAETLAVVDAWCLGEPDPVVPPVQPEVWPGIANAADFMIRGDRAYCSSPAEIATAAMAMLGINDPDYADTILADCPPHPGLESARRALAYPRMAAALLAVVQRSPGSGWATATTRYGDDKAAA